MGAYGTNWAARPRENTEVTVPPRLAQFLEPGSETQELAGSLRAAGYRAYLVGGIVRDVFLDRLGDDYDIDITTDARPDAVEQILRGWADSMWLQGQRFGTVGIEKNGKTFEITTFRADVYHPESRKPDVTYSDDIETDLSRRDFTINAMALALDDPDLVDPFGGLADLAQRRLRTPQSPELSFGDDPLRMLRAARFVATLGFEPDAALVEAMTAMSDRLSIISAERIRDELSKLLVADDPSPGLWLVAQTGLSEEFLPELNAMRLEQDPIHRHKDVLAHTIAVVSKTRPELKVRLAALMHDVGKPRTRGYSDNGVTFHHHEVVGARMTKERLTALRYPSEVIEDVTQLVYLHLRFHTYRMGWTDAAVRRYVRDAGDLLDELNELTRCDCTTRNAKKAAALARRMDELEARIAELAEQEELSKMRPALDGNEIMQALGITPGPLVGEAYRYLLDIRLDEGVIDKADAEARLRKWAESKGL